MGNRWLGGWNSRERVTTLLQVVALVITAIYLLEVTSPDLDMDSRDWWRHLILITVGGGGIGTLAVRIMRAIRRRRPEPRESALDSRN